MTSSFRASGEVSQVSLVLVQYQTGTCIYELCLNPIPTVLKNSFVLITSESPQWIPSSGGWLSWQLPAQGPHCRPGLPTPITAFNSFSFSGVSVTLPSRPAQACAPPCGNGHCSAAPPSWPSGPVLQTHTEAFSRWKQISVHQGIHRPCFPRMQNRQTSTTLFITLRSTAPNRSNTFQPKLFRKFSITLKEISIQ